MKAIVRDTYGSTDILELKEIGKPVPKDHQLLVKVRAASVNPLDWHVLRGEPFLVRLMGFGILKPKHKTLGADVAGTVEAVGKDVTQFKMGDEVFGSGMGVPGTGISMVRPRPLSLHRSYTHWAMARSEAAVPLLLAW